MFIDHNGNTWYKGNLHTHSTLSDGWLPYELVVKRYREAGYDFLSVTDHGIVSETLEENDFITLSGCEYDFSKQTKMYNQKRAMIIHVNGIGFTSAPDIQNSSDGLTLKHIVDEIHKKDGIAFLCHPAWSRNIPDDIWESTDLDGVEILNAGAEIHCGVGDSTYIVDQMAFGGYMLPVIAADDSHHYSGEDCKAYTLARTDDFSRNGIIQAIRENKIIASEGPWLQVMEDKGNLFIECTPVSYIFVYTNMWGSKMIEGKNLTCGRVSLNDWSGDIHYYRVMVADEHGKRAWTSPMRTQSAV